ncbi:MAG: hypothetical protein J0I33_00120 [Microbacterium ginsengisoli]|uniref:phage tail tube protein n=1 Tax=Microbacterium TaxID=33882 RepID=UPI0007001A8A|nr:MULTISPECIES: phage tail tube protein [unclassified Microbacterium]KQR91288.1 hypothetical protein ASF93_08045 [Microbacterium sp. Leaf347]KQS01276.1 hypothetical protein ASG00_10875 [Microbacterium sp. Leaf351]MBN9197038.1 hypothetical protein [Microbacterium ginsengisoli]OJU76996.1 MAG: hypothetical protein BGO15_05690 [Microbacterium sp. 71-23]
MTTQLDFTVGLAKETTYGTAATVSRFFETEAKAKYDVQTIKGKGLRPTKGVARTSRHSISRFEGSAEIELDAPTRGLGYLLNALMGAQTTTLVAGALYQQVHTLSTTDPVPSYTMQEVLPVIGGLNAYPHTFTGCVFDTLDLAVKEGEYVSAKFGLTMRQLSTLVAAAAASYPTDDTLFTFVQGAIIIGGTLTPPTNTAMATLSGTAAVNITGLDLSLKRNLDKGGWNLGGAGLRSRAPQLGRPEITGKLTAEYIDNTLRDAYLSQTALPVLLTFTSGVSVLQIVLPAVRLGGEVPTSNGGDPITQEIPFEAFDDGSAAQPIWIVYRSTDTAP